MQPDKYPHNRDRRERNYVIVDEQNNCLGYANSVDEAKRILGTDIEFRLISQADYMNEVITAFLAKQVI